MSAWIVPYPAKDRGRLRNKHIKKERERPLQYIPSPRLRPWPLNNEPPLQCLCLWRAFFVSKIRRLSKIIFGK